MPAKPHPSSSTRRANAILFVVTLIVLAVVAEIVLRFVYHPEFLGSVIRYDPLLGWSLDPHSSLLSVDKQRGFRYQIDVNALGLRDREVPLAKPSGRRRVVVLGDSFAFGAGLNFGERFSDVLDRSLPDDVEVINAGVTGWGTDQEVLFYESFIRRLRPDVVVLTFLGQNDVVNNALNGPIIEAGTKPRFTCVGDSLGMEPPAPLPKVSVAVRVKRVLRKSRLLLFIKRRVQMREYQRNVVDDKHPAMSGYEASRSLSHWSVYDVRGGAAIDGAWCVTERLFERLATDCRRDSAALVVFAFPTQDEVDESSRADMMRRTGVDPQNLDFMLPYRRLANFCAARGIEFHYPIEEFRTAAQKQALYFERDPHPNAAGNALAAQLLQDVVASLLTR